MNLNDVIENLGIDNYKSFVREYKEPVFTVSKNNLNEILEDKNISFLSNLAWEVLNTDDISDLERLSILFELYDDIPSYYVLGPILSNIDSIDAEISPSRLFLWEKIYQYLSYSDDEHSKNIEYTLDVDYFEDERFVNEVWEYFMNKDYNNKFMQRMLSATGSVPYGLKENLYLKLISDRKWHLYIFKSLYTSKFGGFQFINQINDNKAKNILEQLILDLENNESLKNDYDRLYKALLN